MILNERALARLFLCNLLRGVSIGRMKEKQAVPVLTHRKLSCISTLVWSFHFAKLSELSKRVRYNRTWGDLRACPSGS